MRRRRDAVLDAVLHEGDDFEGYVARYVDPAPQMLECNGFATRLLQTLQIEADTSVALYWFRAAWHLNRLSSLLDDISFGREGPWLLLNPQTGEAAAPYDGGVDLFAPTHERRDNWRLRFQEWLSHRPDGL